MEALSLTKVEELFRAELSFSFDYDIQFAKEAMPVALSYLDKFAKKADEGVDLLALLLQGLLTFF